MCSHMCTVIIDIPSLFENNKYLCMCPCRMACWKPLDLHVVSPQCCIVDVATHMSLDQTTSISPHHVSFIEISCSATAYIDNGCLHDSSLCQIVLLLRLEVQATIVCLYTKWRDSPWLVIGGHLGTSYHIASSWRSCWIKKKCKKC